MTALLLNDVTYTYPGRAEASLRNVSLEIDEGEFCVVVGLSASGKSTLIRAACGLVPHFHGGDFAGQVLVGGLDTADHGPGDLGAVTGTLLQDPETQIVMSTVASELAFALENRGHPPAAVARGVEEVALALGIGGLLARSTDELSGGELQRVALAASLVGRPRLLLLDEPTSQLDPVAGDELVWLLRRLNEEWGTTVVLVEHRLERCLAAADRVLAMRDGRVVCDEAPASFLDWAADAAPELQTPGASLLSRLGIGPAPTGVKQARAALRERALLDEATPGPPAAPEPTPRTARLPSSGLRRKPRGALAFEGVWHELDDGPALLRGVDLCLEGGELVALMGRNGAGKSTLLRHARGLLSPTRGRVRCAGEVALLLQNPNDYFLHDRVAAEVSPAQLQWLGLDGLAERNPRDLSGGERQRLALGIVLDHGGDSQEPVAAVCLDEPTRGMDRAARSVLSHTLGSLAADGAAVLVATHDPEFAAAFAQRVILMAEGRVIADGPVGDILSGGWYFATETARILGGEGQALTAEQGAAVIEDRRLHGARA